MAKVKSSKKPKATRKSNRNIVSARSNIYGQVLKNVKIKVFNTETVETSPTTAANQNGLYGFKYDLTAKDLFSGPNKGFSAFHEYRALRAIVKVRFINTGPSILFDYRDKVSAIAYKQYYDNSASMGLGILRDYEISDDTSFKNFEEALETPGGKYCHFSKYKDGQLRFNWRPTEPTDKDWRKIADDGVLHLYGYFKNLCLTEEHGVPAQYQKHWVTVCLEITVWTDLREMTFDARQKVKSLMRSKDKGCEGRNMVSPSSESRAACSHESGMDWVNVPR